MTLPGLSGTVDLVSDLIFIAGLELRGRLGVPEDERAQPQRLTADLTLHPARSFAELGERLENTVDYAAVCRVVHALVAERPRHLLETLAFELAGGVLRRFPACAAIDVELRKYALSDTAYVAARHSQAQSSSVNS